MWEKFRRHPVLKNASGVVCFLLALGTVVVSFRVNPHSAAWLVGLYTVLAVLFYVRSDAHRSPTHRPFILYLAALFCYLLTVWFLHIVVPAEDLLRSKREVAIGTWFLGMLANFLPIAHFHFAIRFARIEGKLSLVLEVIGWAVTIFFNVTNLMGAFILDYAWAGYTWVPTLNGYYRYFFYATTFYLSAGLLLPMIKLFTSHDRALKRQLAFYLIGDVPLWMTCWSHFLLSMGINLYPAGGLIFIWHISVLTYAALLARVYNVKIVIRRGAAYAFASVILGILYGVLTWGLSEFLGSSGLFSSSIVSAIICFSMAGFLYAPLVDAISTSIDELFFRSAINRARIIAAFSERIATTINMHSVARQTCEVLAGVCNTRRVRLYLQNNSGEPLFSAEYLEERFSHRVGRDAASPANLEHVKDTPALRSVCLPGAAESHMGVISFAHGDMSLIVPVSHNGGQFGHIVIDPKRSDEDFDPDDLEAVRTIAAQCSLALLNARAFSNIQRLQKLTQGTIEGLATGVMLFDEQGHVSLCNSSSRRLLGVDGCLPAEITFQRVKDYNPNLNQLLSPSAADLSNVEIFLREENRPCLVNYATLELDDDYSGRCKVGLLVVHDISDYKRMEALARRHESLAQIGQTIASINHEIKNVLQPVKYQIQQLEELQHADPAFSHAMDVIPSRLRALDSLLQNLKDLSRPIELECRPIDIAELVDSVRNDIAPFLKEADVEMAVLHLPECTSTFLDPGWMRQVLYNIIKNAAESTSRRNIRKVNVSVVQETQMLRIEISDTGCGLSESAQRRLFEPFYSTKGEAGTGLGLSVSRKIVLLHGGVIQVRSRENEGSTFSILLPTSPLESPMVRTY